MRNRSSDSAPIHYESPSDAVCIIPARGTSPDFPKKNFKRVGGKPLVAHTIQSALEADEIAEIVVSTESEELAEIAREYGATVPFLRPDRLSEPDVLVTEAVQHAVAQLREYNGSTGIEITDETPIVVLQPNVPFTRPEDVDVAVEEYRQTPNSAVISVKEEQDYFWQQTNGHLTPMFEKRTARAELEHLYRETGSIYVTNEAILQGGTRVGEEPSYIVTDSLSAFEINSLLDIWLAERIYEGPTIVIRVDGGDDIGMGHVYRCLTIAAEIESLLNCRIQFVSNPEYSAGIEKIESEGYTVVRADPGGAIDQIRSLSPDIVFLDVLNTREEDMRTLHDTSAVIINLEDMGAGLEHADLVVNALYESSGENANQFFGPDYLILREEFTDVTTSIREEVENVLLTFGGSDPLNLSTRVVTALVDHRPDYEFKLVLGPDFSNWDELDALDPALQDEFEILTNVTDMSELMSWADIAVCSGGRTVYELAATGTPAAVVTQNDRESERMEALASDGIVEFVGHGERTDASEIVDVVMDLASDYERRREMSERGRELIDGNGIQRIIDIVNDIITNDNENIYVK